LLNQLAQELEWFQNNGFSNDFLAERAAKNTKKVTRPKRLTNDINSKSLGIID